MTGLPDFWTSGLLPLPSAFWTSGLPIPPISAYCNDWTSGLLDFRTSFFAFGLPDFWPSGLLAFRPSGLPAFWTSGLLSLPSDFPLPPSFLPYFIHFSTLLTNC